MQLNVDCVREDSVSLHGLYHAGWTVMQANVSVLTL